MNIAKHPIFNRKGFERAVARNKAEQTVYILTYFHPSDVAGGGLFSIGHLENNIKYLLLRCKEEKCQFLSMTATEAAERARNFLSQAG